MLTNRVEMCKIPVLRMSCVIVKLLELIRKYVHFLKKTVQVA